MAGGRSPARKGRRVEQLLVRALLECGLPCMRVPLSGAAGGKWSSDIHLELLGRTLRAEVKARAEFRTLYSWISRADLLLLKGDRAMPLVVLPLGLFAELATAAKPVAESSTIDTERTPPMVTDLEARS